MEAILAAIEERIKKQELEAAKKEFDNLKETLDHCFFCEDYTDSSDNCMLLEEKGNFDCFETQDCPVRNSEESCPGDCLAKRLDNFKKNCEKREKMFEESGQQMCLDAANNRANERISTAKEYLEQLDFFETKWWRNTHDSVKKCLIKEIVSLSKTGKMKKSSFQKYAGILDQINDVVAALDTNSYTSKDDLGDYTNPLTGTLIKLIKEVSEEIGTYEIRALVKINDKKYIV